MDYKGDKLGETIQVKKWRFTVGWNAVVNSIMRHPCAVRLGATYYIRAYIYIGLCIKDGKVMN